ncbi:MAG: hypothetical protein LBL67_05830, partial [Coriobacteriales bacterium]|nr:hypothetical protein [Coriobacteriales bacterium]
KDALARARAEAAAAVKAAKSKKAKKAAEGAEQTINKVDWSSDKTTFVKKWTGRINDYLSGTALSGYGSNFAAAAWDYGVDPRFAPAISYTESGCGAHCFHSHNAWGWGTSSWSDWPTAINSYTQGLARGYGYTITMAAARKYCATDPSSWYRTTLAQMRRI